MRRHRGSFLLLILALSLPLLSCDVQPPIPTTSLPESTTEPPTWPVSYPVHILYVREIPQTPGTPGPFVEIALRNSSQEPIVSLNVILKQSGGRDFPYDFRVSSSNPMLPDQTIKVGIVLIGGSGGSGLFEDGLDITGTFQSCEPFGLRMIP